ncbi:MAG: hypothetical protein LQ340_001642 [Diploschistes diacapsis]|nr:MAG: hypothetical protein LQ340_001642 [Diploschistes diacapsis]
MQLPNFESEARRLRYEALGIGSVRRNIETILVAHHADDQAETILARLANNHRGSGLTAMKLSAQIPECRGIFGAYESGKFMDPEYEQSSGSYVGGPEEGGITVQRPLLDFPKSRLVATCRAGDIPWVEDKTNQDHTLTTRNAIRKLLSENLLPAALRRDSLLKFSENIRESIEDQESLANKLWVASDARFDLRSGCLTVELPDPELIFKREWSWWTFEWKQQICKLYLRSLGQCVVAHETMRLTSLERALEVVFPKSFSNLEHPREQMMVEAGGVIFEKAKKSGTSAEWIVSRRPYSFGDAPIPMPVPAEHLAPGRTIESLRSPNYLMDHTQLWDGRFWINIRNLGQETVFVVHLLPKYLNRFKKGLPQEKRKLLETLLSQVAPRKIRWTLPAIVLLRRFPPRKKSGPKHKYSPIKGNLFRNIPTESDMETRDEQPLSGDNTPGADNSYKPLGVVSTSTSDPVKEKTGEPATKMISYDLGIMYSEEEIQDAEIIALPTMGFVLDEWKDKLIWDIKHKKLPLQGFQSAQWPNLAEYPHIVRKRAESSRLPTRPEESYNDAWMEDLE